MIWLGVARLQPLLTNPRCHGRGFFLFSRWFGATAHRKQPRMAVTAPLQIGQGFGSSRGLRCHSFLILYRPVVVAGVTLRGEADEPRLLILTRPRAAGWVAVTGGPE
jgi:hypothetical protein